MGNPSYNREVLLEISQFFGIHVHVLQHARKEVNLAQFNCTNQIFSGGNHCLNITNAPLLSARRDFWRIVFIEAPQLIVGSSSPPPISIKPIPICPYCAALLCGICLRLYSSYHLNGTATAFSRIEHTAVVVPRTIRRKRRSQIMLLGTRQALISIHQLYRIGSLNVFLTCT